MPRVDITSYFTAAFWESVSLWRNWKNFGLPHGAGWINERAEVVQAITIVEEERGLYEQREAEERRSGDSRRTTSRHKG